MVGNRTELHLVNCKKEDVRWLVIMNNHLDAQLNKLIEWTNIKNCLEFRITL